MSVSKLSKEQFGQFVDAMLAAGRRVVGVVAKDDRFQFDELKSAAALRLDYDVTILPPKKYVLPQVEPLLQFEVGGGAQSVMNYDPLVLLGVHPYDLIAIRQMDELFSQGEYDRHYMDRRKQITIIACDVVRPSKNIFASSMETAVVSDGYDILITDIGDAYLLDVATEKGHALMTYAKGLAAAASADVEKRQAIQEANRTALNKHKLGCKVSYLPRLMEKAYNHPVWQEKARLCFSCGSCNQVCPTCYCFDVQDQVNWDLKTGERVRCWDGCLLENFATVAGNHNFRKDRSSRFRHRLFRKAKYVPEKIGGQIACVGCGRCITACVADIANPVTVYNRLMEERTLG
ncbi:MAG TPA: 4Fe-4S dicluster domain-containing protein [Anaerohalosphaeraceae bacterium]|nr:4Fe-4S dicluster domain-containing protein [Anaerohalosphaeraceae bacterium]